MLVIALSVSLGGFVFGYDAVVISGAIEMVEAEFAMTHWQVGWVVSAPTLSAMIASLAIGPLADRFGRRPVLLFVSVLYILSAILSSTATGFLSLSLARLVGGFAFSSLVVAPIFLAEIAPAKSRGGVVSMNQMAIVLGLSAAYFMNLAILHLSQSGEAWVERAGIADAPWRWMLAAELVPAVLWLGTLLVAVPESPRWLVARNQTDKALRVLSSVRDEAAALLAIERIRTALGTEMAGSGRLKDLFRKPLLRAMLGIALIVAIAQQATGVNAIYFYAPTVFQQSGVGANTAFVQAAVLGVVNVLFTVVAMLAIDRVGRRPLLIIGLAGVVLSTSIAGAGFLHAVYELTPEALAALSDRGLASLLTELQGQRFHSDTAFRDAVTQIAGPQAWSLHEAELLQRGASLESGIILASILLFVAAFAVSLGPVTWVLLSEIFPNAYRGMAIALVAFVNSAVSFCIQLMFPAQLQIMGAGPTFLAYAGVSVVFLFLVIRYVPETKGEVLEGLSAKIAQRFKRSRVSDLTQRD
jgi:MFS family permease